MIRSSADAYNFLQIAKNFFKILIFTSEKKNKENIVDLVEYYFTVLNIFIFLDNISKMNKFKIYRNGYNHFDYLNEH